MRQRFNRRQRNYIILGLCSIFLLMAIGYAAFRSQLTINGTSNISSEWKVLITKIQSTVLNGNATDAAGSPSYTDTTATFKTNLVSPGDSMQYNIFVYNQGDIDAVLKSIDVSTSDNEAIIFETSGIKKGDKLAPLGSDVLTVTVTYNPDITTQPSKLDATVEVTLNYVQDDGTILPESDPEIGGQKVPIVTSGDGLYKDSYESGRYIYRGSDPNNYIEFNNELWRIISKESDGTYKIVRNEVLSNRAFDEPNHRTTENNSYCQNSANGCGVYAAVKGEFSSSNGLQSGTVTENSSIEQYLNDDYYVNNINIIAKNQMISHSFNIGSIERLADESLDSIEKNINEEKAYQWTGNVGLVAVTDILRASTNPLCKSAAVSYNGTNECNNNYLLDKGSANNLYYWTINAYAAVTGGSSQSVWYSSVNSSTTHIHGRNASDNGRAPRPTVFLKSIIKLSGKGSKDNPYVIIS